MKDVIVAEYLTYFIMNNDYLIKDYFFNEFENILDMSKLVHEAQKYLLEINDVEFHDEIMIQSCNEFISTVSMACSNKLGLPYLHCLESLEDKLEEIYELHDF